MRLLGWGLVPAHPPSSKTPLLGRWSQPVRAPQLLTKSSAKPSTSLAKHFSPFSAKSGAGAAWPRGPCCVHRAPVHSISTQPPVVNAPEDQSTATSKVKRIKFKQGQKIIKLLTACLCPELKYRVESQKHLLEPSSACSHAAVG